MKWDQTPKPISDWFLAQHRHQEGRVVRVRDGSFADSYITGTGYRMVRYQEKGVQERHFAHRVIWVLTHGPIPTGLVIDHIDRDRLNNSLENLRLVTPSLNNHNRPVKGPHWRKDIQKWQVQVRSHEGVKYLGVFADHAEALSAYLAEKSRFLPPENRQIEKVYGR